jgi:hypothetical protein
MATAAPASYGMSYPGVTGVRGHRFGGRSTRPEVSREGGHVRPGRSWLGDARYLSSHALPASIALHEDIGKAIDLLPRAIRHDKNLQFGALRGTVPERLGGCNPGVLSFGKGFAIRTPPASLQLGNLLTDPTIARKRKPFCRMLPRRPCDALGTAPGGTLQTPLHFRKGVHATPPSSARASFRWNWRPRSPR